MAAEPSLLEVEEFLSACELELTAADELRFCAGEVKAAVLAAGPLDASWNPSEELLARIRAASGGESGDVALTADEGSIASAVEALAGVEEFLAINGVDDKAAEELRGCPPEVQEQVVGRGELTGARNPSAALLARIRDARKSLVAGGQVSEQDVEVFIASSGIDDRAADTLRGCPPHVQQAVIARGDLTTAKNPSAAVLARIRDAEKDTGKGGGGGGGGGGAYGASAYGAGAQGAKSAYGAAGGPGSAYAAAYGRAPAQDSGYGGKDSGYGGKANGYGGKDSGYGGKGSVYGGKDFGYGGKDSSYGGKDFGYGGKDSGYGGKGASYGGKDFGYGGKDSNGYGGKGPDYGGKDPYGGKGPDYGGKDPGYGGKGPDYGGYGGKDAGYGGKGGGYGGKASGYGAAPPAYGGGAYSAAASTAGKYGYGAKGRPGFGSPAAAAAPAGRAPAAGSAGTCHWITVDPSSSLVAAGLPQEAPAIEFDKGVSAFGSSTWILGDLVADYSENCTFEHDGDWTLFPEVGEAWKATGCEDNCYTVARCDAEGKWAVGVASGKKNAERAARLALGVALAYGTPKMQQLCQTYPEFRDFCSSAGLIKGGAKQPQKGGKRGEAYDPEAPPAAAPAAWPSAPAPGADSVPEVVWVTVGPESRITQEGLPADAPAISYSKAQSSAFSNSYAILSDLVGDISAEVALHHDPDWKEFPEVGQALKEAGGQENCFTIGTCATSAKWAVGLGGSWKNRESATRLALSVAIASSEPGKVEQLARTYPEFGALCAGCGLIEAPTKRARHF